MDTGVSTEVSTGAGAGPVTEPDAGPDAGPDAQASGTGGQAWTHPARRAARRAAARRVASGLVGRRARLRWVHLVLGGALLMPYWMLSNVLAGTLDPGRGTAMQIALYFAAFGLSLPMAAVTALVPTVRALEGAAARALCTPHRPEEVATGPARSWAARRRTAGWYVLHILFGGVVSGMTLAGGRSRSCC